MTQCYVYRLTEKFRDEDGYTHELYTVGFYTPSGEWIPESDHSFRDDAADRVHYLNGGIYTQEANKFIQE